MSRKQREKEILTEKEENSLKEIFNSNNKVFISGILEEEFEYDYGIDYREFYHNRVRTQRYSEILDTIPIIVSMPVLIKNKAFNKKMKGKFVEISGVVRSYNKVDADGVRHLELFIFVTEINIFKSEQGVINANSIFLSGYIVKPTVFKEKRLGKKVTEMIIAVNRPRSGKPDYIPCIAWNDVAEWAKERKVGDLIEFYGRFQSRMYPKKNPQKETFEISVMYLEKGNINW